MYSKQLTRENCRFLMIDIQERLLPVIHNRDEVKHNSLRLLKLASLCSIKTDYSEQYPKGLGRTDSHIRAEMPSGCRLLEKTHFSCVDEPLFSEWAESEQHLLWVIWGIEAHICLLSTVTDLLEQGEKVIVAADACGSRSAANAELAFNAARDCGALILPTESIIYRILKQAGTAEFKGMLPLFK